MPRLLRDLAHTRAGDKGNVSSIAVIAYDRADFPLLQSTLTAERVRRHFAGIVHGPVERYELPRLGALNFVMHEALNGGVTRTPNLDAHGKSLSSWMLALEIED